MQVIISVKTVKSKYDFDFVERRGLRNGFRTSHRQGQCSLSRELTSSRELGFLSLFIFRAAWLATGVVHIILSLLLYYRSTI